MSGIFLSHSHEDKVFARRLARDLSVHWLEVWLDEAEIRVGDSLLRKIAAAIDHVDYVVAIISDTSVKSKWVQLELDIAMNREIAERRVFVLPVLCTKAQVPSFLRGKLYADFTTESNYYPALRQLLRVLGQVPSGSGAAQVTARRVNLSDRPLCPLFQRVLHYAMADEYVSGLRGTDEREDRSSWHQAVYEGQLSAAFCFLELSQTEILPRVAASSRVHAVAYLMAQHVGELWQTAREDSELEEKNLKPSVSTLDTLEETCKLESSLATIILSHCPPRQVMGFYYGWDLFCSLMGGVSLDSAEKKNGKSTATYLSLAIDQILQAIGDFEHKYDRDSWLFWTAVLFHVMNTIVGDTIFPLVIEHSEGFERDLAEALEIEEGEGQEWISLATQYGVAAAARLVVIRLRSRFEFVGQAGAQGITISVQKVEGKT